MRGIRLIPILAVCLVVPRAHAESDPWDVPVPSLAEVLLTLEKSEKSYVITPGERAPKEAVGPERVELGLAKDERESLAKARDLATKGDHDGAEVLLSALLAKNPVNWDAHLVRAASLHARGSHEKALASLRESLIGNRRNPEGWKLLDAVAKALGKTVHRPKIEVLGWVLQKKDGEIEVGTREKDVEATWLLYAAARAVYRFEGVFQRDFPAAKAYRSTFREQMFAVLLLVAATEKQREEGPPPPADLLRLLGEKKRGTLVPFAFFAVHPDPIGREPEAGIAELKPRLIAYFDEHVVKKSG